jgi:hypothetical protein
MLKTTGWSLLLGTAALIAVLTLFYAPPGGDPQAPAVIWNATTGKVIAGAASVVDSNVQVVLNATGTGAVTLAMEPLAALDYPYLHIALEGASHDLSVMLTWASANGKDQPIFYTLEDKTFASQWIATAELNGWSGDIGTISLVIVGQPGETVLIRDFSLYPASPWRQLQAIYSDVMAYESWNRATMNTYTGVTNVTSFYPVPLAVALLLLSLLAYGALVALSRGKLRFSRMNIALIFLACWIVLDVVWQNRLWHQLVDTYRTFAHLEPQQRQSVGPDAQLFSFVSQIKPQLAAGNARIFVASSDHYNGMRVAYHLYPLNVYWSVHEPEVPYDEFLHPGDYIALINPSTFRFNGKRGKVVAPQRTDLRAELIFANAIGTLVRLK